MTRGQLLKGAAGSALGLGAAGILAGCENTTEPIGAGVGQPTGEASKLVVPKPVGPGGLPLPRPDNAVTWAITADNPPIRDGRPTERGPLNIYNYADYIDPVTIKKFSRQFGTSVAVATYNSADEAIAKLASGAVGFDVIIGLTGSNIVDLIAQRLLQPLNHSYLPNLVKNIWPELQDPFYDRGSRYTVPYTVWMDGIGWRNDLVREDIAAMDDPWDVFWHSQAYRGRVGILDDKQDALSMPMQRDALRAGVTPDLNTEDPALIDKAERELAELNAICNVKVEVTDYQTLPEAKTVLHHSWSGDLLSAAFYYMPKGVKPDVLSFWGPSANGVVQNDFLCIGRASKSPVLAHRFLDFMLDEQNAYANFVDFTGYTPPQVAIDADALIRRGLIPKTLTQAVVRPDQFAANQELLQLSVEGERLWDDAWSKFKAG
ncbi:MAG TPA: spermidine/putrescine ABC transporter substrate-binding protein [Gaiellaceae bacterium]|nr:spermidine/putrescine ABC transporter substrate-binding protein [Gaiellaceae bacterium]